MERHIEKVQRLEKHLKKHPTDYQAVVAHLVARSDAIDHAQRMKLIERKRRVAEIRRQRKERALNEKSNA